MSPFAPVKPEDKAHIKGLLDAIHQQFVAAVKQGRGQRLKDNPEMFSGLFWTGQQAVELGLADGFGSVDSVARTVIGADKLVDYTLAENPLDSLLGRFGVSIGSAMAAKLAPASGPQLR